MIDIFDSIKSNDINLVEFVIKKGADVNQYRFDGPPLRYAIQQNCDLEILEYLIQQGANVNSEHGEHSDLHHTCWCHNLKYVKCLIQHNANVNAVNDENKTPLHYACTEDSKLEIVKSLIQQGAEVNVVDNENKTPLHYACMEGIKVEIVEYLIQQGADLNATDNKNKTPVDLVRECNHSHITTYLKSLKASKESTDVKPNNNNNNNTTNDIKSELLKFKQLLDEGFITEEEYNYKRKQLLGL